MRNHAQRQPAAASTGMHEASPAARVSDDTFTAQMWRHQEAGNDKVAVDVRHQWRRAQAAPGYRDSVGALTVYEIDAMAARCPTGAAGDSARAFARLVERAALMKAITLLPELRDKLSRKGNGMSYMRGMHFGLNAYCEGISALALGQAQGEVSAKNLIIPRKASETEALERAVDAEGARLKFEGWAGPRQFDLARRDGKYTNIMTAYSWMGYLAAQGGDHA